MIDAKVARNAACKLRQMAREFMGPRFTDRYGDGPEMLAHAEALDLLAMEIEKVQGMPDLRGTAP